MPADQHTTGAIRRATIAIGCLLLVTACILRELPYASIINDTNETLRIVSIGPNGVEFELATLDPGDEHQETVDTDHCLEPRFVARTLENQDYAEQPHQLCSDDEWVITGPD